MSRTFKMADSGITSRLVVNEHLADYRENKILSSMPHIISIGADIMVNHFFSFFKNTTSSSGPHL